MTPARTQQSTAKPAGTTRKVSSARRVFALHGWLGLSLGLPLLLICLSGALAVFGHELDWLCNPAMRIRPEGPRLPLDAIYSKVQRAFPEARIVYWQLSMGSCFADELSLSPRVETSGGRETRVFVNPHTGVIQGVSGYLNVRSFLRAFHYYWFDTVTGWGFYLVAAFAFVLLGSVITGMAIYKRWWAGLFTLRLRRGRRLFFSDLHKLCGGWTLAFNFVIALTAIYYLVEWKTDWELVTPRLSAERIAQIPPNATPVPLDEQLENARHHFPSLRVANIAFPETPADPLYFDGQAAAWVVRERANKLLLDPYDGSVVFIQRGENLASGYRWVETVDRVHFGNFAGVASKIVWCLLGLALPGLILTGAWMGLRRAGSHAWRTLGNFQQPLNALGLVASAALLIFALFSTIHGVRKLSAEVPMQPRSE